MAFVVVVVMFFVISNLGTTPAGSIGPTQPSLDTTTPSSTASATYSATASTTTNPTYSSTASATSAVTIRPSSGTTWEVQKYGFRYSVASVERHPGDAEHFGGKPTLTVNGIFTQFESDGYTKIDFTVFDQNNNRLKQEDITDLSSLPLNQPVNVHLTLGDQDPPAQLLIIHVRNWYWQAQDELILRVPLT